LITHFLLHKTEAHANTRAHVVKESDNVRAVV
jgi:hypothetical protein